MRAASSEECVRQSDCRAGLDCVNNVCVVPDRARSERPASGPDAGVTPDSGPSDGGAPDAPVSGSSDAPVAPPASESPSGGSDDPPESACLLGEFRDVCGAASDCCSGLCVGTGTGGACTESCEVYDDCNPGGGSPFFCATVSADTSVCAPSDFGYDCYGNANCLGGVCLLGPENGACTWACDSSADCPTGATCGLVPVDDGAGGIEVLRVCAPVGISCTVDNASGLNSCVTGLCLVPDSGIGYCSTFCVESDPAACPTGFECLVVGSGDPICVRPGDL